MECYLIMLLEELDGKEVNEKELDILKWLFLMMPNAFVFTNEYRVGKKIIQKTQFHMNCLELAELTIKRVQRSIDKRTLEEFFGKEILL